jgi:hypothetical protein
MMFSLLTQGLHPSLNPSKILYPDIDFGSFAEKFGAWTSMCDLTA